MACTRWVLGCLAMLLVAPIGCAAPSSDDAAAQSDDALTSVRAGHYAIVVAPLSGSYVKDLTISAGKKFEMEYVENGQATILRGKYATFAGSSGATLISFDVAGNEDDSLLYQLETVGTKLRLSKAGWEAFELEPAPVTNTPTDARVLTCTGHGYNATITLDKDQRRSGTLKVTRTAQAEKGDPPNGTVQVTYTGDTGVSDYMAYAGRDRQKNGYEFNLRRSELERTSGSTSPVGVGFTPATFGGSAMHTTLACTIAKP